MPAFDPYHKWLGIPPAEQPPSHYRLLGISPRETDGDVIASAADQRMNYLHQFANSERGADAQRMMDEIARASMCLLDPTRRAAYDATLRSDAKTIAPQPLSPRPDTTPQFQSAPKAMYSRPTPTVVVDEADASYKPRGKDRSVLYFWLWNLTLLVAIVVLAVLIGLRRQQQGDAVADNNAQPDAIEEDDDDPAEGSFLTEADDDDGTADDMHPSTGTSTGTDDGTTTVDPRRSDTRPTPRATPPRTTPPTRTTPVEEPDLTEDFPIQPPDEAFLSSGADEESPPEVVLPPPLTLPADVATVLQSRDEWSAAIGWETETLNTIEMPIVLIPPGEFEMGGWTGNDRTAQTQQVSISQPFYMGRHEVTQQEWRKVMGDESAPSYYSYQGEGADAVAGLGTNRFPVENITWLDAIVFCNALSQLEMLEPYYRIDVEPGPDGTPINKVVIAGGTGYRLPTEAEWEYACKAGTITAFDFGESSDATPESFNSALAVIGRTAQTEGFRPNTFGLYDMHGNAWEWCYDWFDQFQIVDEPPLVDPTGPEASIYSARLIRGGSYISEADRCMSTSRAYAPPEEARRDIGFRIVRTLEPSDAVTTLPGAIAEAADEEPRNLLDDVHPELHADGRPWERTDAGIVADNLSSASFLTVPGSVPEEYDLHIRLTIEREQSDPGSDVHISLPQARGARGGRTAFPFVVRRVGDDTLLSFWPSDPTSGEFGVTPLGVTLVSENPFADGSTLTFQVRSQTITVLLDDEEQFVFRNFGRATSSEIPLLKLGSWQNRVVFHSAVLTPLATME